MSKVLPLFTSHYSIRDSILTLEGDIYKKDEKGNKTKEVFIEEDKQVSVFAIAKIHELDRLFIVDDSPAGFWQGYKYAKEIGVPCRFGLKICVCADMYAKDDKDTHSSRDTESNVIIFLKNSQAYQDAIQLYSKAAVDGNYYKPRLDWKTLNEMWTPNLSLALPFYSSFLAKNTLYLRRSIIPDIERLNPTVFIESHELPQDLLLTDIVQEFARSHGYPVRRTHSIYFYKEEDHLAYMTLKCIDARTTLVKPNLDGHGSDRFSFESYLKL